MKTIPKRDRKGQLCKTQPDELDSQIRVSLGQEAQQRLRDISCVNHLGVSRYRDWTLDEYPSFKMSTIQSRRLQTAPFCNRQGPKYRKPLKIGLNIKDLHYIRRLNRTQGSMRGRDDETQRKACNSITVNFDADPKEQTRIHSNGQPQIEFENTAFKISTKALKEVKSKIQSQHGRNRFLFHGKGPKSKVDRTKTSLPYRKLAARTTFASNEPLSRTQTKPIETVLLKNDFTLTKEFIEMRALLMQERKNIFYPIMTILSVKHRGRSIN